jgi:hypothetical protein
MFKIITLALIIACLSSIVVRCYDKFYNKQYTKQVYLNNFFQVLICSILVLYVDEHFSNSNLSGSDKSNIGGSSSTKIQTGGTSTNTASKSLVTDIGDGIASKLKFDTGVPNF